MFEYYFLGTSAAAPSIQRGLTAQVLKHEDHRFLIDCGEGTQRQILRSGLGFKRLNRVLITHGHLDHILGLGGLLSTFTRWEAISELEIWAGRWALERIHSLLYDVVLRGVDPPMPIHLREVHAGELFVTDKLKVTAFPVDHRGPDCFGYLFEEQSHRPFIPERAEALGIPPGPLRRELVSGNTVTLSDGREIQPEMVLGFEIPGTRIAHVGDTGDTSKLEQYCENVDLLVIEATYINSEAVLAKEYAHLTATQAAQLAKDTGVKHLILTHLSRRYRDWEVLTEAREIFSNSHVARDLDVYRIHRGNCIKVNPLEKV